MQLARLWRDAKRPRPVMLAVAGDSGAGKATLARGILDALGPERVVVVGVDDYLRHERRERECMPITALNPASSFVEIMAQHVELLALGQPILKPTYDHREGTRGRPVLVEPRDFVVVEGLLALHPAIARGCYDLAVYLDPPEPLRLSWKLSRDSSERGYSPEGVKVELARREAESAAFIRPQRSRADVVVRFCPTGDDDGVPDDLLAAFGPAAARRHESVRLAGEEFERSWSAMRRWRQLGADESLGAQVLLRPSVPTAELAELIAAHQPAVERKLARDEDGKPVDAVHVRPANDDVIEKIQAAMWKGLGLGGEPPASLGTLAPGRRSGPLAITQLVVLCQLMQVRRA